MSLNRLMALAGLVTLLGLSVMLVSLPVASAGSPNIAYKTIVSFHSNNPDPTVSGLLYGHTYQITFYNDGTYRGNGELYFHTLGPAGAQIFPVTENPPWGFVFFKVQNEGTWTVTDGVFILLTETDTLLGNGFQVLGCADYLHGPPCSVTYLDPVPFGPVLPAGHYSDQFAPGVFQQVEVISSFD